MNILEIVKSCRSIAVGGHVNPDGDCVGACMGTALYLRRELPDARVDVYLEHISPELERNVPGTDTVRHTVKPGMQYDAFIILDAERSRLGFSAPLFDSAKVTLNIDHHISNAGCAMYNYVDPAAGSASELVAELIGESGMDAQIAQALYVGIVTDTGMFQYPSTSEKTMRTAGMLMRFGFDFSRIAREVFFLRTPMQTLMRGIAFTSAKSLLGGLYILCVMDHEVISKYHADRDSLDSISSQLLLTQGADCAVFAHESEPGTWRVSLRSVKIIDVSRIAAIFGGGGHLRAAGCTIHTEIGEALRVIEREITAQLGQASTDA